MCLCWCECECETEGGREREIDKWSVCLYMFAADAICQPVMIQNCKGAKWLQIAKLIIWEFL